MLRDCTDLHLNTYRAGCVFEPGALPICFVWLNGRSASGRLGRGRVIVEGVGRVPPDGLPSCCCLLNGRSVSRTAPFLSSCSCLLKASVSLLLGELKDLGGVDRAVLRGYDEYTDLTEESNARVYALDELGVEKVMASPTVLATSRGISTTSST